MSSCVVILSFFAHGFIRRLPWRSASRTLAGWSAALLTRFHCFFALPLEPIQTVDRITLTVFLPYIVFSPYALYFAITFIVGSLSNLN